ncbi:MAG: tRNA 2-thiouridine(34) synthase MnmA [Eggerthellaceae bacterium]|jgi:tRNA-specific 2-thiouridylase
MAIVDAKIRDEFIRETGVKDHESVLVGMSGGVDSSVAAMVLMSAHLETSGITLKLFDADNSHIPASKIAAARKDAQDAENVCETLGISHEVYSYAKNFTHDVVENFCNGYLLGLTPNPCIDCNRYVKFHALNIRRKDRSLTYLATGHYARRTYDEQLDRYLLKTGKDLDKDQSYVLFHLTQADLAHTLFPLGGLSKADVRNIASQAGLVNASKEESQDICFIPDGNYANLIKAYTGKSFSPGPIVDTSGTVLGEHHGLAAYTIGQRKGIGIASSEPLYVCGKDTVHNTLIVGKKSESIRKSITVKRVNFISVPELKNPLHCLVKTHYRHKGSMATVTQIDDDTVEISFDVADAACAPGQAAVFYQGEIVVGGGTITTA